MVDAAIEPVEHPGGDGGIGEQIAGAQDEIVEIEPAAQLLGLFIGGQEGAGEGVQGAGFLECEKGKASLAGVCYPLHPLLDLVDHGAEVLARRLGWERANLGGKRGLCASAGEENILEDWQGTVVEGGDPREFGRGLDVVGGACLKRWYQLVKQSAFITKEHARLDLGHVCALWQIEGGGKISLADRAGEAAAVAGDLGRQIIEGFAGIVPCNGIKSVSLRAGGQVLDDLGAEQAGSAIFHLGELRRDARLEREAAQEGGAEGVDGLDRSEE